jgi:hypothetical protein
VTVMADRYPNASRSRKPECYIRVTVLRALRGTISSQIRYFFRRAYWIES